MSKCTCDPFMASSQRCGQCGGWIKLSTDGPKNEARAIHAEKRADLAEGCLGEIEREFRFVCAEINDRGPCECDACTMLDILARHKAALSAPTKAGGRNDDEYI
jgi:hypothetical protein